MFYKHRNEISSFALYNIPSYIKQEYPLFVKLLQYFYEFMEEEGNVLHGIEHLTEHNSFMSPYNKFWERIYNDAGFPFSNELKIDKRQFFNYLMDFYLYRGSVKGLKFLLAVLYGEDCSIEYPREDMLVPSIAEYTYNQYIVCKMRDLDVNIFNKIKDSINEFNLTIKSNSSDDALDVENVYTYIHGGDVYLNLKVNYKEYNKFRVGEQLTLYSDNFSILCTNAPLVKLNIKNRGSRYKVNDVIKLSNTINQGLISVKTITTGGVQKVKIKNGGIGYSVGDYIYASRNIELTGGGFYGEVTEVNSGGSITAIKVMNEGRGYKDLPNIGVVSETGTGAILEGITNNIGGIVGFNYIENYVMDITNTKKEYITCSIESKNGSGAEFEVEPVVTNNTSSFYRSYTGFIGNKSYLTDSLYYQQYCYKIVSNIPRYVYDNAVDVMAHPTGYIRYAGFNIIDDVFGIASDMGIIFYKENVKNGGNKDVIVIGDDDDDETDGDNSGDDNNNGGNSGSDSNTDDESNGIDPITKKRSIKEILYNRRNLAGDLREILGDKFYGVTYGQSQNLLLDYFIYQHLYTYKATNTQTISNSDDVHLIYDTRKNVYYPVYDVQGNKYIFSGNPDINTNSIYIVYNKKKKEIGRIKFVRHNNGKLFHHQQGWYDGDERAKNLVLLDGDTRLVIKVNKKLTIEEVAKLDEMFGVNMWKEIKLIYVVDAKHTIKSNLSSHYNHYLVKVSKKTGAVTIKENEATKENTKRDNKETLENRLELEKMFRDKFGDKFKGIIYGQSQNLILDSFIYLHLYTYTVKEFTVRDISNATMLMNMRTGNVYDIFESNHVEGKLTFINDIEVNENDVYMLMGANGNILSRVKFKSVNNKMYEYREGWYDDL